MTVREYLNMIDFQTTGHQITFIKARARMDAHTPSYHYEYQTTPIYNRHELKDDSRILDYIVLNDSQAPIDWLSGAPWKIPFNRGDLLSLLVVSKEDLELKYHPTQATSLVSYIDDVIRNRMHIANQSDGIKSLRTASGLSQQKFSDYFGIPKRTICNWETGVNQCADYLLKLMEYKLKNEGIIQ